MTKSSYCYPGCNVVSIIQGLTRHIPVITPFISNPHEWGITSFNVASLKHYFSNQAESKDLFQFLCSISFESYFAKPPPTCQ